ncbi:hypothetical protein D3C76_1147680 [compost metagenome]
MAFSGDNDSRCRRVIFARGRGDFAFTRRANKHAVLNCRWCAGEIVFRVPAVTQQGVRNARIGQRFFSLNVFNVQAKRGFIRMQQAGVSNEFHACRFGRVNDVLMLSGTLADFAGGDQHQFIHAA